MLTRVFFQFFGLGVSSLGGPSVSVVVQSVAGLVRISESTAGLSVVGSVGVIEPVGVFESTHNLDVSVINVNPMIPQTVEVAGLCKACSLVGSVIAMSIAPSTGPVLPPKVYAIALSQDLDYGLSPPAGRLDLVEFGINLSDINPTTSAHITHLMALPVPQPFRTSSKRSFKKPRKPPLPIKLASSEIDNMVLTNLDGQTNYTKSQPTKGLGTLPLTAPDPVAKDINPFSCLADLMDADSDSAAGQIITTPAVGSFPSKGESQI